MMPNTRDSGSNSSRFIFWVFGHWVVTHAVMPNKKDSSSNLLKVHVLGVGAPSRGHQHSVQPLYGFLAPAFLLHMQGEAAVALLLDAGGGALGVDVEPGDLVLLRNEVAALLVKAPQRQRLHSS